MFAQKLITLSAIVLIFAIMNINAQNNNGGGQNRGGRGRPPSGVLAMMSLCLNCPKAQTAIDAVKTCITSAGAGNVATAIAAKTGEDCFKQLFDMRDSVKSMADKLNQCGDALKASGGNDLKDCIEAQKPGRGGPGGSKNQNNQ